MPKQGELIKDIPCGYCENDTEQEFKGGGMHPHNTVNGHYHVSEIFHCECGTYNYREYSLNFGNGEKWNFQFTHLFKAPKWAKQRFPKTPDWIAAEYNDLIKSLNDANYEIFGIQLRQILTATLEEATARFIGSYEDDYRHLEQKIKDLATPINRLPETSVDKLPERLPESIVQGLIQINILTDQLTNGHYATYIKGFTDKKEFMKTEIRKEIDGKILSAIKIFETAFHLLFEMDSFTQFLNSHPANAD